MSIKLFERDLKKRSTWYSNYIFKNTLFIFIYENGYTIMFTYTLILETEFNIESFKFYKEHTIIRTLIGYRKQSGNTISYNFPFIKEQHPLRRIH
jgi:hypothetical protein